MDSTPVILPELLALWIDGKMPELLGVRSARKSVAQEWEGLNMAGGQTSWGE